MEPTLVILTNVPDDETAKAISTRLVAQQLAACVNILPQVRSIYRWQGKVEESTEVTLLIKSTSSRYAEVEMAIKAYHPYEVPEIIALPIMHGLPAYLNWVVSETKKDVNA